MSQLAAEIVMTVIGLYLLLGLLFAVPFVVFGLQRIDPRARGGSVGFRLLVLPGSLVLWPLLARRWLRGLAPPEEKNAHRLRARRDPGR